ncbi:MAG TPA: glycerophosphodiester phosphodiesterase [Gemmatimonadales bacterium]|jgi:glycerophosphoryl diester phosphodiesterase|nr:glycerophosphodiester phosphodiesterase [Gemmatimonadales bacterium]
MPRPSVIAHRGASGYEYENSLAAFRRAIMLGSDGVELDVHATRDGGIVIHHDPEIPGLGPIARLELPAVRQARLRNGEPIPLLAEVLDLMGERDVWVEVKALDPMWDQALLATLAGGPAPARYAVHSFEHAIIGRLGRLRPDLRRGVLLAEAIPDPVGAMKVAGARTLWAERRLVDQALVDRVHAAEGALIAWTVNELSDLRRLAQLGVDGLCGNYPDRIRIAIGLSPDVESPDA